MNTTPGNPARVLPATPVTANTLHETLTRLYDLLAELTALSERKLSAMRAANAVELQQIALLESRLLPQLVDSQQRRDAVLARLAQSLHGLAPDAPRLSAALEKLPEPWRSKLAAKTEGLRALAEKLKHNNRLAADVAQGVQSHIRAVFAAVAEAQQEAIAYARDGTHERTSKNTWIDAVG